MTSELIAEFPWGVLLVTDSESSEQIPNWASPSETVAAATSALAVRVRQADEGGVVVRVLPDLSDAHGQMVFDGILKVDSGVLKISDALGGSTITYEVSTENHRVRILTNSRTEATEVDLIVGE